MTQPKTLRETSSFPSPGTPGEGERGSWAGGLENPLPHPPPAYRGRDNARGGARVLARLSTFAADIKIHHTIFALPFALLSTFLAADGMPPLGKLVLILLCMVTARTVAMSMNRLLDARLDATNPRTSRRAIPSGALSARFFVLATGICAASFIAATAMFQVFYRNPWPLVFAVPVLLFVGVYPLLKRFTRLCHYYLGAALALAPVCAWVAIRGDMKLPPLLMFVAVLFWTAGFDILYACQDRQVDIDCGLYSVPAKIGIAKALWVARASHLVSAAALVLLGIFTPQFGWIYFAGVALAIVLLVFEHLLVKADDLSKLNVAFFTLNGIISLAIGALGIADVLVRKM